MEIETIFKYLGKRKTLNFIKNRGLKSLSEDKTINYCIYELSNYGLIQNVIEDYLLIRNEHDFNKYLE